MKRLFVPILFGFLGLLVASCGQASKQGGADSLILKENASSDCPLEFASQGLCGKLVWEAGPTADGVSSFRLVFWSSKDSTKTYQDPQGELKVFLRMSCCGTVVVPKMEKEGPGNFKFRDIQFVPGNWEVHLQIHQGNTSEEKIELISLNV